MIRLVAVGDVGIHGAYAAMATHDPARLTAGTELFFRGADLVLGNLEVPLARSEEAGTAPATGHAPIESAALLRRWGFTHLSLANNHIMDLGPAGLATTMVQLRSEGLSVFGAGEDANEAERPCLVETDPPLALLGYSMPCRANAGPDRPGSARFRETAATRTIEELRAQGRLVIVSLHLGRMYLRRPSPTHLGTVRRLLRAGASLVLCTHSHVPAGMIGDEGSLGALGMGDFLYDPMQGEIHTLVGRRSRRIGFLLGIGIDEGSVLGVTRLPLILSPDRGPELHPESEKMLRWWSRLDEELRMRSPFYRACYYGLEYPRLLAYVGHAAAIHASRGNWKKVYDYTLGLVMRRRGRA